MTKLHHYFINAFLLLSFLLPYLPVSALTIAEKKAALSSTRPGGCDLSHEMQKFLVQINRELAEQKMELRELYQEVGRFHQANAASGDWERLLLDIQGIRGNIKLLEESFRKMAEEHNQLEDYALWHQPDTTIGDLVIDYGAQDFVYLIPSEIAALPISINSNIPVPRSNWNDMLVLILSQSGIGVRQLNPYLRELYALKDSFIGIQLITQDRNALELVSQEDRVLFLLSPKPVDSERIWLFLEKFVNKVTTDLDMIGRNILITGPAGDVRELIKVLEFVEANTQGKEYKIVALRRAVADELATILESLFVPSMDCRNEDSPSDNGPCPNLRVIPFGSPPTALFLIGDREEIRKAEDIIHQVECEIGEADEKVIYTYTCKHTDTEELADILEKVYNLMVQTGTIAAPEELATPPGAVDQTQKVAVTSVDVRPQFRYPEQLYRDGFYQEGTFAVNPAPTQPGRPEAPKIDPNAGRTNFIVDPKTGAIVMVVESFYLPKLKELIRRLDVPKKMVQIEVLLFEKRIENENSFGLNLLRLGTRASQTNDTSLLFNDSHKGCISEGITQFFLSRMKTCGFPAFDLAYKFLISRDDVTINASPSVVAINQTKATININEEISINTGIFEVETAKGVTLKDSFTRAQYGITIDVTPTIHLKNDCDGIPFGENDDYVTLETDIYFQTIHPRSSKDRPDVTTRHIENTVRIPDGQTVILGGLRRKISSDCKDSIPFLGELPGIGKLFSSTTLKDSSTEMFIFLTPKIISDPHEDFLLIRSEEMSRRPGDIPGFMKRLVLARECEKNRLMQDYMTMLFGREPERFYYRPGEYNGY